MNTEIIIAFVGAITTVLGAVLGNIQGRKKSNAEAGLMQIQTLEEIRKFYETTISSQSTIVLERDKRINALEAELAIYKQKVDMLQQVVSKLMNKACIKQEEEELFDMNEFKHLLNSDKYNTEKIINYEQTY